MKKLFSLCLVSLFAVGLAHAAMRDFSGTWVTDKTQKSSPDASDRPIQIKQTETTLTYGATVPIPCDLDGSMTRSSGPQNTEVSCQFKSLGVNKIVLSFEVQPVGNTDSNRVLHNILTLELSDDGKSLMISRVDTLGDNRKETQRFFTKQE